MAATIKQALTAVSSFLNTPYVKENIKTVAGGVTFLFGVVEVYDIYQSSHAEPGEAEGSDSSWKQTAEKIGILSAKVSLLLAALSSRPMLMLFTQTASLVFPGRKISFDTPFSQNPYLPRHVLSIAATVLALPSVLSLIYQGLYSLSAKKEDTQEDVEGEEARLPTVTDPQVQSMAFINLCIGRPMLHWANALVQHLIRHL